VWTSENGNLEEKKDHSLCNMVEQSRKRNGMLGESGRGEPWSKTHLKETQRALDVKNYHKK
jgi:hypothetical protein